MLSSAVSGFLQLVFLTTVSIAFVGGQDNFGVIDWEGDTSVVVQKVIEEECQDDSANQNQGGCFSVKRWEKFAPTKSYTLDQFQAPFPSVLLKFCKLQI